MIARLLVYEGKGVATVSKKCFSCDHFLAKREVLGVDRFCAGAVIRIRCSDEGECSKGERKMDPESRCSGWKLFRKLERLVERYI